LDTFKGNNQLILLKLRKRLQNGLLIFENFPTILSRNTGFFFLYSSYFLKIISSLKKLNKSGHFRGGLGANPVGRRNFNIGLMEKISRLSLGGPPFYSTTAQYFFGPQSAPGPF